MLNWASVNFENFANGLLVIVVALISALGIRHGHKARTAPPAQKGEDFQLAGAVIDSVKVDELIAAFDRNTKEVVAFHEALRKNTVVVEAFHQAFHEPLRKNTQAVERSTTATNRLREDTTRVGGEMRNLTDELLRGGGKR